LQQLAIPFISLKLSNHLGEVGCKPGVVLQVGNISVTESECDGTWSIMSPHLRPWAGEAGGVLD